MPFFADNKLASFMRCKRGHCELVFSCVVKLYLLGTNGAPSKTSQRKWTTIYNLQRIHLLFAVLCISTTVLQKFHQNSPASRHRKFFLYYYTLYSFDTSHDIVHWNLNVWIVKSKMHNYLRERQNEDSLNNLERDFPLQWFVISSLLCNVFKTPRSK